MISLGAQAKYAGFRAYSAFCRKQCNSNYPTGVENVMLFITLFTITKISDNIDMRYFRFF
jgi:hypothetical protein